MSDPNTQTRWRQWLVLGAAIGGIGALISAGMYLFEPAPQTKRERPRTVKLTAPGTLDDRDMWRHKEAARLKLVEKSIDDIERKQRHFEEDGKRVQTALDGLKTDQRARQDEPQTSERRAIAGRAKAVLESPLPAAATYGNAKTSPAYSPPPNNAPPSVVHAPASTGDGQTTLPPIEVIAFGAVGEAAARSARASASVASSAKNAQGVDLIPAGSFVRAVMLNGVDAPTGGQAQSNPLPLALQVEDMANLANRYRLDIRECRIIAVAWGDLSSERTMGRTETLNCIIDGEATEIPLKGTLMGEDGKVGIRGRLVTKQGQILANALLAGGLAGIGRAFQSAASTTTTSGGGITETIDPGRVAQAGIGGGVGQAGNLLAQYYLKAADKLFPVIETDGGRVVEVLITKSAVYTGKREGRSYRALLRRAGASERSDHED